jgi:hypothetical protein
MQQSFLSLRRLSREPAFRRFIYLCAGVASLRKPLVNTEAILKQRLPAKRAKFMERVPDPIMTESVRNQDAFALLLRAICTAFAQAEENNTGKTRDALTVESDLHI